MEEIGLGAGKRIQTDDKILVFSAAGFGAGALLMARYRMQASVINSASTYGLAARAIGLGTLISVSSVGLLVGTACKVLDIHCMNDLRRAVKEFMSRADHTEYEIVLQPIKK